MGVDMAAKKETRVYVVFGADDFLRRGVLDRLLSQLLGGAPDGLGLSRFDGGTCELEDVLDTLRTPSLLSDAAVVCVRDADEFVTKHRVALEAYVDRPSPDGVLVLESPGWRATTRLHKAIKAQGGALEAQKPKKPYELRAWVPRWLEQQAAAHGCKLGRGVAARLYEQIGDDLGVLDNELEKLATFALPRTEIRVEDVEALVGVSREQTVFRITDAIANRQASAAMTLWRQVLATDRDAPYKAVGGLAYGVRKLVQAKSLMAAGLSLREAVKATNIFADDVGRQLERFSVRQWEDILLRLLRIDYGAKSGLGGIECAVEKLISDLCAA